MREQVSVNIPKDLYDQIKDVAGDIPVEHYVRATLSRSIRQREKLVMVTNIGSLVNALEPWERLVTDIPFATYGGVNGGNFGIMPDGRVSVAIEAWFLALGPRIQGHIEIGELSEHFSLNGKPNPTLIARAKQTVVPWDRIDPTEAPIDESDKSVFDALAEADRRIWEKLERLGVQKQDRLMRSE